MHLTVRVLTQLHIVPLYLHRLKPAVFHQKWRNPGHVKQVIPSSERAERVEVVLPERVPSRYLGTVRRRQERIDIGGMQGPITDKTLLSDHSSTVASLVHGNQESQFLTFVLAAGGPPVRFGLRSIPCQPFFCLLPQDWVAVPVCYEGSN